MTHRDGFPSLSARSVRHGDAMHRKACATRTDKPWEAAVPVA